MEGEGKHVSGGGSTGSTVSGGGSTGEIPEVLQCPECRGLMKNSTQLPCCSSSLCRPCAYRKIMLNKKMCWFKKTERCSQIIQLDQLSPALEMRELIQDYLEGGTKYKETGGQQDAGRRTPEYEDFVDVPVPHQPILTVKTENIQLEEEYSELGGAGLDLTRVKMETDQGASKEQIYPGMEATQEYAELPLEGSTVLGDLMRGRSRLKRESTEDDEMKKESGGEEDISHPYILPNTPSSARTEHQSSGYWSDDSYEGPFFGKLHWTANDPSKGYIECWDGDEMKKAYVSRLEVKCGAESGDLVEFTLRSDPECGKIAKRVKLVEKALPLSDEDQIRSQGSLKRSLEMSAGMLEATAGSGTVMASNKKIKTEFIIDAETELQSMTSTYMDIAAEEEPTYSWHQVKPEVTEFMALEDQALSDECICASSSLTRCGVCPMYFLRSESQHLILEGESVTFVARIEGAMETDLKFVRHLSFPFMVPTGSFDLKLLATLGPGCIVKKVTSVFRGSYVFVSIMNDSEYQVNISPGNIVGICQAHTTQDSEVSQNFIMEPPDRQDVGVIPISVKRKDFSRYEQNHVCGFAEIGDEAMNYKYCLVTITLSPEFSTKFSLLKDEMTVQIKRNIWLEFIPKGKGYENLLPKSGIIGYAKSIMDEDYVEQMFRTVSPVASAELPYDKSTKLEPRGPAVDPYESMMMKLDMDIGYTTGNEVVSKLNPLDKIFRGVTNELITILPGSERTVDLYLTADDDYDPKNLIKLQVEVSNNDEFKYYNNCYNIDKQVCKVVNSRCKLTNTLRPSIKVILKNQRSDVASLPVNSSVALVKIYQISNTDLSKGATAPAAHVDPYPPTNESTTFSAVKKLEKEERKCLKNWEKILHQNIYSKSLLVEERYPYFTCSPKPKIPFGLKLPELTMRVGITQDARPTRVIEKDRSSGIHSCTICDVVMLDKYNLQDHIYSEKHRNTMKLVQVIAGIEERVDMNRPVIQEMLDQFKSWPLLGLDHIFEIVPKEGLASYHCALCNVFCDERGIMPHLISNNHNFSFMKEFFQLAWARFSTIQDISKWTELDLDCYQKVIHKIYCVYGQRRPSILRKEDDLEAKVDNIPVDQYSSNRTEIDTYLKNLKHSEITKEVCINGPTKIKTITRIAVTLEHCYITPGKVEKMVCRISNIPNHRSLEAQLVLVARNPSNNYCEVKPGLSRVFLRDNFPCIFVNTFNSKSNDPIEVESNIEIALVKWKK